MARKSPGGKPRPPQGDDLLWLETYFIVFPRQRRPTLARVEQALTATDQRFQVKNLAGDEEGLFASVLVESPEDHAAVEISYETGDAVVEQSADLAKQLKDELQPKQLQQMLKADARLDVMLFERVRDELTDDEDDEEWAVTGLDPSSLLNVVGALAKLTGGLPIDPASGAILS